jgi:hypothetical protein
VSCLNSLSSRLETFSSICTRSISSLTQSRSTFPIEILGSAEAERAAGAVDSLEAQLKKVRVGVTEAVGAWLIFNV